METAAHIQMLFRITTMGQESVDRKEHETDPEGCPFSEPEGSTRGGGRKRDGYHLSVLLCSLLWLPVLLQDRLPPCALASSLLTPCLSLSSAPLPSHPTADFLFVCFSFQLDSLTC